MIETLKQDLKTAMRARDKQRLATIRMLISSFQNAEIENRGPLSEEQSLALLSREVKRRREAAEAYRNGDRLELAEQEEAEVGIISDYLPKQLSEQEVRDIAQKVIADNPPASPRDMGKIMGRVMPQIKGRYDGKAASALIRDEFNKALS